MVFVLEYFYASPQLEFTPAKAMAGVNFSCNPIKQQSFNFFLLSGKNESYF